MSVQYDGLNTAPAVCRDCGEKLEAGAGCTYSELGYDWDNPDEDTQGSVMVVLERYTLCYEATRCTERVVKSGTNMKALHAVVNNKEDYSQEIRDQARAALIELAQVTINLARSIDLVARENGYGAIGGARGER